jgi:type IV secretory pathway VirB10-like protein
MRRRGVTVYRAIVLTTLVLLLSAIAGVSVAQEGTIFTGEPNSDDPSESTMPEPTSLEATGPEDTTTSQPPDASSGAEDRPDVPEPTVVTEPPVIDETTAAEPEKPAAAPAKKTPTPGANDAGMPGDRGRKVGKPEHASKAPGLRNAGTRVGPHDVARDVGKPSEREDGEPGPGAGRPKVVLCHKGKTLTVGAPAQAAHLRHGDSLGACP